MMKPEGVRTAAEMSLGLLQMDQIDVLMINWPMAFQVSFRTCLRTQTIHTTTGEQWLTEATLVQVDHYYSHPLSSPLLELHPGFRVAKRHFF
jgi:diketogulonate reductase-like aldo/keto reductase